MSKQSSPFHDFRQSFKRFLDQQGTSNIVAGTGVSWKDARDLIVNQYKKREEQLEQENATNSQLGQLMRARQAQGLDTREHEQAFAKQSAEKYLDMLPMGTINKVAKVGLPVAQEGLQALHRQLRNVGMPQPRLQFRSGGQGSGGSAGLYDANKLANSAGVANEARIQEIPLSKISGTDYTELDEALTGGKRLTAQEANDLIGRTEDLIADGRRIDVPISVGDNGDGTYYLLGGNNRIAQALVNGQKTITATSNDFRSGRSFDEYAQELNSRVPQAGLSDIDTELLERARVHKSADEFMQAEQEKGNVLYRGAYDDELKNNTFFADFYDHAKQYADEEGTVQGLRYEPKDVYHFGDREFEELRNTYAKASDSQLRQIYDEAIKEGRFGDAQFQLDIPNEKIVPYVRELLASGEPYSTISNTKRNDFLTPLLQKVASDKGKNIVSFEGSDYYGATEYLVGDTKKLTNLSDVWEKAQSRVAQPSKANAGLSDTGKPTTFYRGAKDDRLGGFTGVGTFLSKDKNYAKSFAKGGNKLLEYNIDESKLNVQKSVANMGEQVAKERWEFTDDLLERPQDFKSEIEALKKRGINAIESYDGRQTLILDSSLLQKRGLGEDVRPASGQTVSSDLRGNAPQTADLRLNPEKNVSTFSTTNPNTSIPQSRVAQPSLPDIKRMADSAVSGEGVQTIQRGTVKAKLGTERIGGDDGFDTLHIADIENASKGNRNSSELLNEIIQYSNESKIPVSLVPLQTRRGGLSTQQLKDWYKRKGFIELPKNIETQGDYSRDTFMLYTPTPTQQFMDRRKQLQKLKGK